MSPNADGGYRLPEVVDPQRIRFCVEIPDDINHIAAFWGALTELTKWWNWERDDDHTAALVIRVWQDVIAKAHQSYLEGDCLSEELCQFYRPTSARITWFPENPFHPNEEVPDGYNFHPYTVVDSSILGTIISVWGLGYEIGDVYTDITKIPPFTFSPDLINNLDRYPSFKLDDLTGTGTVKLHFLNIPQGGRAVVRVDNDINPTHWNIVELNKDLVSFPQENQTPIVIEIKIDTDGDHFIDVTFLPTVDDAFIPLFFGAGFRGVELCGFGREGCGDVTDPCCPDELTKLDKNNLLLEQIISLIQGGFKVVPISDGLPNDFRIDCTPAKFDGDDGDTDSFAPLARAQALCVNVARYVAGLMYSIALGQNAGKTVREGILTLIDPLALPSAFIRDLNPMFDHNNVDLADLSFYTTDEQASFETVVCMMVSGLTAKDNTFTNFEASLTVPTTDTTPTEHRLIKLAKMVFDSNANRSNFTVFTKALDGVYGEVVGGLEYDCPCEIATTDPCEEPLSLITWDGEGHDAVIELVAPDIYHITQSTTLDSGQYFASIKESTGRCLRFEIPEGYTYQPSSVFNATGCCDDPNISAQSGDFAGNRYTGVQWFAEGEPIDTYIKITCEDCCAPIELYDFAGTGCTITYLGQCIYRFTQPTEDPLYPDHWKFSFSDIMHQCLHVEAAPSPYFTQGVSDTISHGGACGAGDYTGIGGFTPGELGDVTFWSTSPTDYKITLATP